MAVFYPGMGDFDRFCLRATHSCWNLGIPTKGKAINNKVTITPHTPISVTPICDGRRLTPNHPTGKTCTFFLQNIQYCSSTQLSPSVSYSKEKEDRELSDFFDNASSSHGLIQRRCLLQRTQLLCLRKRMRNRNSR